jgi:hypothetical protein
MLARHEHHPLNDKFVNRNESINFLRVVENMQIKFYMIISCVKTSSTDREYAKLS